MRIAIFSNTYLPTISGVVRSVSSFKIALEELGHEVHVFTQGARGYRDRESNVHRYKSFYLGLPNDLPLTIPFSRSIYRLLKELRPDVIHSQHPVLLGNLAQKLARQMDVPLVYTLHAQYWHYGIYMPLRFLEQPYNDLVSRRVKRYIDGCDHIIAPSESLKDLILERFRIEKPVTVIPTGIDLEVYELGKRAQWRKELGWEKDFVLISTGRLAPEKNWPDLIQAVAKIIKHGAKVRLVLLGDGPDRIRLTQLVETLSISSHVQFHGMVPFEDVPKYLIASDLFVFTSLTETQGLVTMEALAAALPIVAYDAIGTRDIVSDGVNGRLTKANPEALEAAITTLIRDPQQLARLRKGSVDTAKKMDIHILAKDLIKVYETSMTNMPTKH